MKTLKAISLILCGVILVGCGGFTKGKPAAEKAIAHFHDLYNQGKLDAIWKEADPAFRSAASRQKYDEFMAAVQRKLGKVSSTVNNTWNVSATNLKTTVYMTQQTTFEKGQGTESFTFALDGTNAVLAGYNIQSMDLITK
jgi:outer membrane lipopolysaccharide assembly protein LptE/RlpB